jgi:hypothetical protein
MSSGVSIARLVSVNFLDMVGDVFVRDVPFAIVARWYFRITLSAEELTAVIELLVANAIFFDDRFEIQRNLDRRLTTIARMLIFALDDRSIVIVDTARDHARARAQRTFHRELRQNRFTNKLAFVLELPQKLGEIFLDFERNHFGLLRLFCGFAFRFRHEGSIPQIEQTTIKRAEKKNEWRTEQHSSAPFATR